MLLIVLSFQLFHVENFSYLEVGGREEVFTEIFSLEELY